MRGGMQAPADRQTDVEPFRMEAGTGSSRPVSRELLISDGGARGTFERQGLEGRRSTWLVML